MNLTEEQIQLLEDNEWTIMCVDPFEMEFCSQFCGTMICKDVEEAIKIHDEIVTTNALLEKIKSGDKKKKLEVSGKLLKQFRASIKELLVTGITEGTLLEFLNSGVSVKKYNWDIPLDDDDFKVIFKEVFDEVDPP